MESFWYVNGRLDLVSKCFSSVWVSVGFGLYYVCNLIEKKHPKNSSSIRIPRFIPFNFICQISSPLSYSIHLWDFMCAAQTRLWHAKICLSMSICKSINVVIFCFDHFQENWDPFLFLLLNLQKMRHIYTYTCTHLACTYSKWVTPFTINSSFFILFNIYHGEWLQYRST